MQQQKFIFICGLHRSGTSLLYKILKNQKTISGFKNTTAIEDEGEQKTKLEASTKDKGELFASFSLYHGACNEVYKGKKEVYLKDSVYTFYQIDGSKEVIKENMATFWKEIWDSNDVKVERKRSKECVANKEKGAAIIRAKQQKNKDIKNLKKNEFKYN